MVTTKDLEGIPVLQGLERSHLEQLAAMAEVGTYSAGTVLFRHRQTLSYYHLLLEGSVALILETDNEDSLTLETLEPGSSFGISALIPGKRGAATAVCREDSTVIHLPGDQMLRLFERDSDMGYRFMCREVRSFKSRMHQRTRQFILAIERHPEFEHALQNLGRVDSSE